MRKILFIFLSCLTTTVFGYALIAPYQMAQFDHEINTIYQSKIIDPQATINKNIETVSEYFLGRPYKLYSMGEGPTGIFDQNPPYRTDAFDCETFVIMVMALSRNDNLNNFKKDVLKINYAGYPATFTNRKHFTETQWNPDNTNLRIVKNITQDIYPNATNVIAITNITAWFKNFSFDTPRLQLLHPVSIADQEALTTAMRHSAPTANILFGHINYIPREALIAPNGKVILDRIPSGSIIQMVEKRLKRPSYRISPYVIPHFGFAIQKDNQLLFRNASQQDGIVEDVPLTTYLRNHPKFIGIHVLAVISHQSTMTYSHK